MHFCIEFPSHLFSRRFFFSRVQIYKHAKYTSTFQWFSVRSVLLCLKFVVRCFYSLVHCASSNEFQWHFDFGHVTHDFDAQCTGRVCSKKWPQRVYGEHLRKVFFCVWIIKQLITMHILHFGCYCGRKENNNENIIREGLELW